MKRKCVTCYHESFMKNHAKEMIVRSMKKKAEERLSRLNVNPERMFRFIKSMKKDKRDVEGRRCMRWSD